MISSVKSSILINVINMSAWISRDEVLQLLGLKPQTLYAYVSRRLIAAHPDPGDPRRSLYSRADAERLRQRRMRGRRAAEIAESAISWGEAVLPTAISTVAGGRLFYRGRDAVRLASQATLEEAAALLWNVPDLPPQAGLLPFRPDAMPVEAALSMLAIAAHASDPTLGRAQGFACCRSSASVALGRRFTRRRPGGRAFDRRRFCPAPGRAMPGTARRSAPRWC